MSLDTPTNVVSQFDYTYDASGRRVSIAKSGSAFGDLSGSVDTYTYNVRSELTSARRTKNGQPIPGFSEDFDYDPIGNRRSSATYNEKGEAQTSTYEANNLNQYTSRTTPGYAAVRGEADPAATVTVNENPTFRLGSYYFGSDLFDNAAASGLANLETYATLAQTAANGDEAEDLVSAMTNQVYLAQSPETFAYDDDGNQTLVTTKTGLWRVTYNGENRPILWVRDSDGMTLTMSYDHMGRRREKNAQHFFYDGYLQIHDNQTTGNKRVEQSFAWDPTEPVATRPLYWQSRTVEGDSSFLYTHDGNKNVSEVVFYQRACGVTMHYEYAPFGETIEQLRGNGWGGLDLSSLNPFRFSSEYAEDELCLVYYNFRHYNYATGRWSARDVYDCNLYSYCRNVLLRAVDHLGLSAVYSSSKFPGSDQSNIEQANGIPPGSWVLNIDDNQDDNVVELIREDETHLDGQMRSAAKRLCEYERDDGRRSSKHEKWFDTDYHIYEGANHKYYLINGQAQIWAENEINYIGIGMYEAWLGHPLFYAKGVTWAWKIYKKYFDDKPYYTMPSDGTMYWLEYGYNNFRTYYDELDPCTCERKK